MLFEVSGLLLLFIIILYALRYIIVVPYDFSLCITGILSSIYYALFIFTTLDSSCAPHFKSNIMFCTAAVFFFLFTYFQGHSLLITCNQSPQRAFHFLMCNSYSDVLYFLFMIDCYCLYL